MSEIQQKALNNYMTFTNAFSTYVQKMKPVYEAYGCANKKRKKKKKLKEQVELAPATPQPAAFNGCDVGVACAPETQDNATLGNLLNIVQTAQVMAEYLEKSPRMDDWMHDVIAGINAVMTKELAQIQTQCSQPVQGDGDMTPVGVTQSATPQIVAVINDEPKV